ncbi:MAG TPA: tRNA lysidine(34) synthetase TilS [Actinomycetes bacterium]|nr:tRNA lysidine(34) synthetase TilS [Actinomycetes bacterium]
MARAPAELRAVAAAAARATRAAGVPRDGDALAVAVSGGADSLAALHALRTLAGPRRWRLAVVTVDHGLRAGSAADAAFVAAHARELGLPVRVCTLTRDDLEPFADQGREGAARTARYRALDAAAGALGCAWIATGHTRDDQAETVLLALLRGAGPDGLAAMAVVGDSLLRPLLGIGRAQTRACCAALGLGWREDPSNADESLLRNAVRRRVLPLLEELRPGAAATLARTAELARAERDWAERAAAEALARLANVTGGGVCLPVAQLAGLPLGLARRVVRAAARTAGQEPPGAAATELVLALARPGAQAGAQARWTGGLACVEGASILWPRHPAPGVSPPAADPAGGAQVRPHG